MKASRHVSTHGLSSVLLALVITAAALLVGSGVGSVAADAWIVGGDGAYTNSETGFVCPKTVGAFTMQSVGMEANPNLIGACQYIDPQGRHAEVRVRRYIVPAGAPTDTAADIARTLADTQLGETVIDGRAVDPGLNADTAASKCSMVTVAHKHRVVSIFLVCSGAGPALDNEPTERDTATMPYHNTYVIDCVTWEKKSIFAQNDEMASFRKVVCGDVLQKELMSSK